MQGRNEKKNLTSEESIIKCSMPVWALQFLILLYNDAKLLESSFLGLKCCLSLPLSLSWILRRCSPRTEWHHRVTRVPPRLSQLRQLYLADNHGGEEPHPAHLRHAGTGGRLWYCISLWRSAVAWQLKNEVRSRSVVSSLIFFLFETLWWSPLLSTHHRSTWHLDSSFFT